MRSPRGILLGVCAFLVSLCAAGAQGTFNRTITFNGPPVIPPGSNIGVTYYYEDSMTFTPINPGEYFVRAGGGISVFPEKGSAYLLQGAFESLASSRGGTRRLGLSSVDLSEFSSLYSFPKTVQFVGHRPDGSTVTAEFTTDGIIDGTGPLPDFQTFYFDQRFSVLVRFEVPTYTYALDNLVFFDVIPEPTTATLMALGADLLAFHFLKSKRRL